MQCLQRNRLVTQLCLHIWSGGMPVLLACSQMTSFWPSQPAPSVMSRFCIHSGITNLSLYILFINDIRFGIISLFIYLQMHVGCILAPSIQTAYPSEAPFRCSTPGQAPGLTRTHQTRLERLARDKHSSLLQRSVNYGRKRFYSTGSRASTNSQNKTFYGGNFFVVSCNHKQC